MRPTTAAPFQARLAVQFHVPFAGPGGIATTPTISKDGQFVLIGDNESNLVAVDLPALPPGSACGAVARAPVETKLGASVTVTPENRVLVAVPSAGVIAFDVGTYLPIGSPAPASTTWSRSTPRPASSARASRPATSPT